LDDFHKNSKNRQRHIASDGFPNLTANMDRKL